MRLKNILIVVEDIQRSIAFYRELFGLQVILDQEGNVILTEGLVLQERKIWERVLNKEVSYQAHDAELYFEENDLDGFQKKLDGCALPIEYVNRLTPHSRERRVIRIYDPDHHVIEIGESMEHANAKRHS